MVYYMRRQVLAMLLSTMSHAVFGCSRRGRRTKGPQFDILFQELEFENPTDRFFVARFDADAGELMIAKQLTFESTEPYRSPMIIDGVRRSGFQIARLSDEI